MDKKRSKGVTIFAWSVIILGVFGVMTSGVFRVFTFLPPAGMHTLIIYSVVTSILSIAVGVYLLRLKEWARKVIVIFAVIGVVEAIVIYPISMRSIKERSEKDFAVDGMLYQEMSMQYDNLPDTVAVKSNLSKEEYLDLVKNITVKGASIVGGVVALLGILYSIFLFIFFRKVNVKAQFAESGDGRRE